MVAFFFFFFLLFRLESGVLTRCSGICSGFPAHCAGGTFQIYRYCGIGGLSWRTSGLYYRGWHES